jgi:ribonucleoside-diphosphate reductase beta chain
LVSFVDSAPLEEQQIFLTTQLVDTARHVVFFDRFYTEVLGADADIRSRLASQAAALTAPDRAMLMESLPQAAQRIRAERDDIDSLIEGVRVCHEVVALQLLARYGALNGLLEDHLPGLREGLNAISRDVTRHSEFGTLLLADTVGE